ncbi:MAG: hypothetical protein E7266_03305 [Lachnospiraceae bacterium]|nr:hypothetical protein [Lachnospiraceae bacterium]
MKKGVIIFIVLLLLCGTAVIGIYNLQSDKRKGCSGYIKATVFSEDEKYIMVEPIDFIDRLFLGKKIKVSKKTVSPYSIREFQNIDEKISISFNKETMISENDINVIEDVYYISFEDEKQDSIVAKVDEIGTDYVVVSPSDDKIISEYGEKIKVSKNVVAVCEIEEIGDNVNIVLDKRYVIKEDNLFYFYNVLGIESQKPNNISHEESEKGL